jgi:HD-GYP domain-containing protein (c-di-GMP phosphodiesterase class II)
LPDDKSGAGLPVEKLKETLEGITKTLSITVATRDPYTAGHQRRVAELSLAIGREMALDDNKLDEIRVAVSFLRRRCRKY